MHYYVNPLISELDYIWGGGAGWPAINLAAPKISKGESSSPKLPTVDVASVLVDANALQSHKLPLFGAVVHFREKGGIFGRVGALYICIYI